MIKTKLPLFLSVFFIVSVFLLIMANNVNAGLSPINMGCCGTVGDSCTGCEFGDCAIRGDECTELGGIQLALDSVCDIDMGLCINNFQGLGCCIVSEGICNSGQSIESCNVAEGMTWYLGTECSEIPQCAPLERNVPTISVWGLLAMAGILGIVGFMVIRRKQTLA